MLLTIIWNLLQSVNMSGNEHRFVHGRSPQSGYGKGCITPSGTQARRSSRRTQGRGYAIGRQPQQSSQRLVPRFQPI